MSLRQMGFLAAAAFLVGCSGNPDAAQSARKSDQSPIAGADPSYAAPGWKPGDAVAWEQHLRARTQQQNEYARTQQVGR